MIKVYKNIIIIFAVFITINTYSQDLYEEGKIVLLTNDTLQGFLKIENENEVFFQENSQDDIIVFHAEKILHFTIDETKYVSKCLQQTNDTVSCNFVFLEIVVEGSVNMYAYNDVLYLENNEYLYTLHHSSDNPFKYKSQLQVIFANCLSMLYNQIDTIEYEREAIRVITEKYNQCYVSSNLFFDNNEENIKNNVSLYRVGLYSGLNITLLKFSGTSNAHSQYLLQIEPKLLKSVSYGFYFDINFIEDIEFLSFYNSLYYTYFEQEYDATNFVIRIGLNYVKMLNALEFQFGYSNIHPTFMIGMTNGYAIKTENYFYKKDYDYEELALKHIQKYEQGVYIGVGLKYQRFNFQLAFEKSTGFSNYSFLNSNINRFYALFSYDLFAI